jgi:DNA-binding transcriptional regulator YiaG
MTRRPRGLVIAEPEFDPMTATEFDAVIDRLGLSQVAAARLLGFNERTVRRWALGETPIPDVAARFLRYLVQAGVAPETVIATLAAEANARRRFRAA